MSHRRRELAFEQETQLLTSIDSVHYEENPGVIITFPEELKNKNKQKNNVAGFIQTPQQSCRKVRLGRNISIIAVTKQTGAGE